MQHQSTLSSKKQTLKSFPLGISRKQVKEVKYENNGIQIRN